MSKTKGSYYERRVMQALEKVGYHCVKSGGSLSEFDIIALGPDGTRAIQVKGGAHPWCSPGEKEAIRELTLHPSIRKELWLLTKYQREPVIEIIP